MNEELFNTRLEDVKRDIYVEIYECNKRGLLQTVKWLAELNHGLNDVTLKPEVENYQNANLGICPTEMDNYYLAKTYFECREYDRAAYFTRSCKSAVPKFLHLYASYMSIEKKRLDNMTETTAQYNNGHVKSLTELLATLKNDYGQRKMDGYMLWLYGVILKKLDLTILAIPVFLESINQQPTLWGSWLELSPLITDKEKLHNFKFPDHWMRHIFIAHAYNEIFLSDEALKIFEELQLAGFNKCIYVTTQMGIAYQNKREVEKAIEQFNQIQEVDPYRLDYLDIYSNLLFVKELKTEMSFLAHRAVDINKYRPETCCVIGNYYSIRADHQKAVLYFQRALKLNPQYLSAWTLMGHEFMEMKNTNAAIQSYRQAVDVNSRDFRAWYGLGQAYEILKMPFYSLYYYNIAQKLRPYDSRMLVALGESYEKLDKKSNALKCYKKANNVGDIEGTALWKLAELYDKMGDTKNAVPTYLAYSADEKSIYDKQSLCKAFLYLGHYYESEGNYEKASCFAYKCLEYDDVCSSSSF